MSEFEHNAAPIEGEPDQGYTEDQGYAEESGYDEGQAASPPDRSGALAQLRERGYGGEPTSPPDLSNVLA